MNSPDPYPVPHKTGLPTLVVVGIGCLALLLLMCLLGALGAGLFFVRSKPVVGTRPMEMSRSDGPPVVMTTKPDESTVTSGDSEHTLSPRWVPLYPAAQAQSGGMRKETKDKVVGTYLARTKDVPDKVKEYFDSTLKADGFATEVISTSVDGNDAATVMAKTGNGTRTLTITATREKEMTNLVIAYEGTK